LKNANVIPIEHYALFQQNNKQYTNTNYFNIIYTVTRMWANAQRDGHPAEYIGGALCSTPQSLADAYY